MALVKTIELNERIEEMRKHMEYLERIRDTEPKGISEIICKKYVEYGKIQKVWEYLSENQYKKDSGIKYSKENISEIIDKSDKNNIFSAEAKRMLKGARKAFYY